MIDGIDDTPLAATPCAGGDTLTPAIANATGFHACIVGGNTGNTAQLFLTSGVDIGSGNTTTYTADTKVVARARTAPINTSQALNSYSMSFRTLDPSFSCDSTASPPTTWTMRTDFGNGADSNDAGNLSKWNHLPNRQPQPIKINDNEPLIITSVPRNASNCRNRRSGNGHNDPNNEKDFAGNSTLGENESWNGQSDTVVVSHKISLKDPRTFNGDADSCSGNVCASSNDGNVLIHEPGAAASLTPNPVVKMFKLGSEIPNYGGFDIDGTRVYDSNGERILSPGDQLSLGEFLASQSPPLAVTDGTNKWPDGGIKYRITSDVNHLGRDERIIAFEVGHNSDSNSNPGVDFQDNAFIIKSDAFKQKYSES
ncbi:MAG: hypothetical protein ACFCAD_26090, partial [Pleurocapsa sp.]